MDFKKATELFADPAFDGEPVIIYEPKGFLISLDMKSLVASLTGGSGGSAGGGFEKLFNHFR